MELSFYYCISFAVSMFVYVGVLVISITVVTCETTLMKNVSFSQFGKLIRIIQGEDSAQITPQVFYYKPVQEQKLVSDDVEKDTNATTIGFGEKIPKKITNDEEKSNIKHLENTESNEQYSQQEDNGFYYIYHPDGNLQKVEYITKADGENTAYRARLKYQNIEPINGPIYTYDPKTFVFRKI